MKYVKGLNEIAGENEDETSRLKEMAVFAISWLSSCSWCTDIVSIDFGFGVGDIIASFYFRITPINQEIDSELWVVVGDVPPAYLVKDKIVDGHDAILNYCVLMQEWVDAIKGGKSTDNLIPVNVPPTIEWADTLNKRLDFIRKEIL